MDEQKSKKALSQLRNLLRPYVRRWDGKVSLCRCEYQDFASSPVCKRSESTFWSPSHAACETYCKGNHGLTTAQFHIGSYIEPPDRHGQEFQTFLVQLSEVAITAGIQIDATCVEDWEKIHGNSRVAWPGDLYTHIIQKLKMLDYGRGNTPL